jgi:hypothetical protein
MKYPRFYTLFLLLLISNVVALSQHPVLKYLSEIPPLPDNICNESDEKIMKWNDILLDIKNKVEALKVNEEQVIAEAETAAKPRTDMFETANSEKIKKLLEEIRAIEENTQSVLRSMISEYADKKGAVELKYIEINEALEQQKKDTEKQGKSTNQIVKKIQLEKTEKCKAMATVRREYFMNYLHFINENIDTFNKADQLSDELRKMMYTPYTYQTKYGLSFGFLLSYLDELLYLYDDKPFMETERENI